MLTNVLVEEIERGKERNPTKTCRNAIKENLVIQEPSIKNNHSPLDEPNLTHSTDGKAPITKT